MENDDAVPTLPCRDLDETVDFYTILGFRAVLKQKSPSPYAVLLRGGAQIHFFGLRGLVPEESHSGCIVHVDEVEELHARFSAELRAALGKLPLKGLPRITRKRRGQTRFSVVDPSGNWILFARRDEEGYEDGEEPAATTPLGQALHTARRLRDFKNDNRAAARVLDVALRKVGKEGGLDLARALVWRAELGWISGEVELAEALLETFQKLTLAEAELAELEDDLAALNRTKGELPPHPAPDGGKLAP